MRCKKGACLCTQAWAMLSEVVGCYKVRKHWVLKNRWCVVYTEIGCVQVQEKGSVTTWWKCMGIRNWITCKSNLVHLKADLNGLLRFSSYAHCGRAQFLVYIYETGIHKDSNWKHLLNSWLTLWLPQVDVAWYQLGLVLASILSLYFSN